MHEIFLENLRNPAHNRRAGLMRQFRTGQVYSITLDLGRYFLKHWMRVLPIENSARGGFIPINLPNPGGTRIPRYIRIITFRVTTARDAPAPGGCDPSQFRTFFLTVHLSIHI
jgi:hypothetical protein